MRSNRDRHRCSKSRWFLQCKVRRSRNYRCSEDARIPHPHPAVGTNCLPPRQGPGMVLSFASSSPGFCLQALHRRTLSLQPNRTPISSGITSECRQRTRCGRELSLGSWRGEFAAWGMADATTAALHWATSLSGALDPPSCLGSVSL